MTLSFWNQAGDLISRVTNIILPASEVRESTVTSYSFTISSA